MGGGLNRHVRHAVAVFLALLAALPASALASTGEDLNRMPRLDLFFRLEVPLSSEGRWKPLAWDANTSNRTGKVLNQGGHFGWSPSEEPPAINGAYYAPLASSSRNDGDAVSIFAATPPGVLGSYASLWLNMPSPGFVKSGYEMRWTNTGKSQFTISLKKWSGGTETTLGSIEHFSFAAGGDWLALTDKEGELTLWARSSSEASFSTVLSAKDSSYTSGYTGISGTSLSRSASFSAGNLGPVRIGGLATLDSLSRNEVPLSNGGSWAAMQWATGTGARTGQLSSTGWRSSDTGPAENGAYWTRAPFNDTSGGDAADATLQVAPTEIGQTDSLWLDMPEPSVKKSGYQLSWTKAEGSNMYSMKLIKWSAGSQSTIASKAAFEVPVGTEIALIDSGEIVEAVTGKSGTYSRALSAEDKTYSSGFAGIQALGTQAQLTNFRAGSLRPTMYWGAWVKNSAGESPFQWAAQEEFEKAAGREASVVHFSSPWFSKGDCGGPCHFNEKEFDKIRKEGAIPFFSWGPNGVTATDAEIAGGAEEAYIREWADQAKKWGHPFFLRFAWEMNASWFRWGVGNSETHSTAADFVAMWKRVHGIFVEEGATNVTWVWCPNIDPEGKYEAMKNVYPGPEYVDWTCLDAYNEGGLRWKWFSELLQSSYNTITAKEIAPTKPMIIGETASTELEGSKAEWITKMFSVLPSTYPLVHGLLWFDKHEPGPGGNEDWPIESSTAATAAFATGLQSLLPATPEYKEFEVSPIPPTP